MGSSEPVRMKAIIKDPQHLSRVVESVQDLNMKQNQMDVCFVCARGRTVYAHKLVLCSVSIHMKKMFLELPDNIDAITIHLPDINARILRFFMDFLNEGELRLAVADYDEFNVLMEMLGVTCFQSSLVQAEPTALNTRVQQNKMVQTEPPNEAQVDPMDSENQMVQCSSQRVVQGSQPTMVNNNHLQRNSQNQVARPSYHNTTHNTTRPTRKPQKRVMASSADEMTTSRTRTRTQTQYYQSQVTPRRRTLPRSRATAQPAQHIRNAITNNTDKFSQTILKALIENYKENNKEIESLTAKQLREILEQKLRMDLSSHEEQIEQLLESLKSGENVNGETAPTSEEELDPTPSPTLSRGSEGLSPPPVTNRRRRRWSATLSDNPDDSDFDPTDHARWCRENQMDF